MRHSIPWTMARIAAAGVAVLSAKRLLADRRMYALRAAMQCSSASIPTFDPSRLDGVPEPARRYLRHAIAPGTPLFSSCRLWMDGTMTPRAGSKPLHLSAAETLAPRTSFVWTARGRLNGLPVRVHDFYADAQGGIDVVALGLLPLPFGHGPDVARSSRGRLVAEAVWCPTALVHPDVRWDCIDHNRIRYSLPVDGEAVEVTLEIAPDGALRSVAMERWGNLDGLPWRQLPYGFEVLAERSWDGITIPARLTGGWHFRSRAFDPATAATFVVRHIEFG